MGRFKKIFSLFMILMIFIVSFSAVKSVSIRTVNFDSWDFNVSTDFAVITPGIILNGNLFTAIVRNDTNPATIFADITLSVLSGKWEGDYLIIRFGPIELNSNETFILKNTEILDYLDMVTLKENNMTHISNLEDTTDFLNLELAEGKYELKIEIFEDDNNGNEVSKGVKSSSLAIINPDPIEFIKLPEGDTLYPTIKWSLSRVPWYSKTTSELEIEENGQIVFSRIFNHNEPDKNNLDLDIKGYPTGNNIEDGIFTYNITGEENDPIFKRGKTYTFRVIMKDSGGNVIAKTLDENITFDLSYPDMIYPTGEIEEINPIFEWNFDYDSEVAYYLLQIDGFGNLKVYGSQSYQLENSLDWGKFYKWKVIPYYEDNTPFFEPSEIEWMEFSTPQNNPPEVEIINPVEGDYLLYGETYTFEGNAVDNDPDDEITETWWEIEGKKYSGLSIEFTPKRRYIDSPLKILFFAKDKFNNTAQTEVNVFVKQPKLYILKPSDNSKFIVGENVEFEAFSQDLDEDIIWYDGENEIGSGEHIEYLFEESGEHIINVVSGDLSDSITIFIETVPVLSAENTEYEIYVGDSLTLTVEYENLESQNIQWILNGRTIGNEDTLEYTFNEPGNYTIIAKYETLSVTFNILVKNFPEIRIVSPLNNAKIKAGEEISLKAESKYADEDIIWYIDGNEIGKGEELKYTFNVEAEGPHTLMVKSGIASHEISIEIYVERFVKIISPKEKLLVLDINQTYLFKAEKQNIEEDIQWFVNDENIDSGSSFEYTFTKGGKYIIKAEANGFFDEITVNVVGEKYLIITSPQDGALFEIGQPIKFIADSKNLIEDIMWYANEDEIGKGNSLEYSFNEPGDYEIKAVSEGIEHSIIIKILPPETLNILSPEDGSKFFIGQEIEFEASGENLRGDIQWFANDVLIGNGKTFTYVFNAPGDYEIKAKSPTKETTIKIKILESQTLQIISPNDGNIYKLGKIVKLKANTRYETSIEWYANDTYLGEGKELEFIPENYGNFEIKAVADNLEKLVKIYVYKPISDLVIDGINNDAILFDDETIEAEALYEFDEAIGIKEKGWMLDGESISNDNKISISNLKPGNHILMFKIMDNMNNYAEIKISFKIIERLEIKIISPDDGSHFNLNDSIRLKMDLLKGNWNQIREINWYFNNTLVANGKDALVSNVGEGDIIVKVEVQDILDETYTKEISINISDKPVLEILMPKNNSTFKFGEEIKVVGNVYLTALEGKQNLDTNDIIWYLDGTEIGNGGVMFLENLEPGEHIIQAEYKDIISEINIKILDPIKAKILDSEEIPFNPGEELKIKGEGDGVLLWYLNGVEIGKGSILILDTKNITSQSKLTLKAVFNDIESEDSISLLPNTKPIISWEVPENEEKFVSNANIPIEVKVEDAEDGLLTYSVYIDGVKIGENINSIFAGTLNPGVHSLKIFAKDKLGVEISETRKIIINQKPNPTILSPQKGQEITAGMSLILEAIVQDDDPIENDKIIWMVDGEKVGNGLKFEFTEVLSTGEHFIDLYVEDQMGEYVQLSTDIVIVEKPNIRIIQPINDSIINIGSPLILQAEAFKGPNLPFEDNMINWKLDGTIIGTGKRIELNTNSLTSGEHAITAQVENVSDSVRIIINTQPIVDISQPLDGSILSTKELIIFKSSIIDAENNIKPENIKWFINGEEKGSGVSLNAGTLSAGDYRITVKAIDDNGLTGEKSISIKVISPLIANISSPENQGVFSQTAIINLTANISGGLAPYQINWTIKQPNTQDKILNGNNLNLNAFDLKPGNALILLEIKDALGNIVTKTKEIKIFEKTKVLIVKPENGHIYVKGQENINAVAKLFNAEGKNAKITWFLNDKKVGDGSVININTNNIENGNYVLKVNVKTKNEDISNSVNIIIREKLKIKILSTYDTVKSGEEITLKAFALDPLDGDIENIEWSSNLQGILGTGKELKVKLIPGKHLITAIAKNSKGKISKDTINILSLGNIKLSIESPSNGDIFTGAVEIPFKASALDADGSEITPENIIWISNIDGQIGNGLEINKKLSAGKHEITLTVMSKFNGSVTKKISIQVLKESKIEQNLVIDIEDGLLVIQNQPIELKAYKVGIDGDIIWNSDIDGELGTGDAIEAILSTPGIHKITASVGNISKSVKIKVIEYQEKRNVVAVVISLKGNAETKYKDQVNVLKILSPIYNKDILVIYNNTEIKLAFKDGTQKTYTINTNEGVKFENKREITFHE
ncbi:PKD-like domain-containing protein [Marinitoga hydrogenitolerans DSM 16785]|uniref:PKD-like domain-containing protein n=1 Tax=Marinitoga hydrogenitolerans (strain DSM 16785 / JCM 12826 / AT1271) TaxID=1122195 RepID=A0A1M4UU26_MARH1|nr:PKD-like domain-containing protein [Marinitoga hydrogenitolerans]SHE60236.1 PKD-like domain-containing protein [Marinitoga hydrogenitolerans DSM 16785]